MIVTSKLNEITKHPYLLDAQEQIWRNIHLESENAYFLVKYSHSELGMKLQLTDIVWRVEDLSNLCQQIRENISLKLIGVSLLSPPNINGSGDWNIERISQIWYVLNADDVRKKAYLSLKNLEFIGVESPASCVYRLGKKIFDVIDFDESGV